MKIRNEKIIRGMKADYDEKIVRTLKDMQGRFFDSKKVERILKSGRNPVIYKVFVKKCGGLTCALTIVGQGAVGKEFYMTKGHKHKKPRAEKYVLLSGDGRVIVQNRRAKIVKLQRGKEYTVPRNASHRLVNVGKQKLEVLTIYQADAGHDYKVKFKKRLFKDHGKEKEEGGVRK